MGSAFLILLLLVLCGFIAYIGDLLGRRLGKKRLSLFGLRPKHTAIILTIVTGVVIAALTFGAALLTLEGFREVVARGPQMFAENRRLEQQNRERRQENEGLARTNQELQTASQQLQTTNRDLQAKNSALQTTNEKVSAANAQLKGVNQQLSTQNATLVRASAGLKATNQRVAEENRRLSQERAGLRTARERLTKQVAGMRSEVTELRAEVTALGAERYVFQKGQSLGLQVVPQNPPPGMLQNVVRGLEFAVEKRAREQNGGRAGSPVVQLVRPDDYPLDRPQTSGAIRQWLVARAERQRNQPLVFYAVADQNVVQGRTVPVRLEWATNKRIFGEGQEILRGSIDGAASEGMVMGELVRFLQEKLRKTVIAEPHSMVPGDTGVGEMSWDQLLEVCRRVKKVDGRVEVIARARRDTLRAGPLNVDVEVRPLGSSALGLR